MSDPVLVLFDVDGTIFDSQHLIVGGFKRAFRALDLQAPSREAILYTVGLSLDRAIATMAPSVSDAQIDVLCAQYVHEVAGEHEKALPIYPGMKRLIGALHQFDHVILGVATGKNRRGLDPLLRANGMEGVFFVKQTADTHPSKPAPDMIIEARDRFGFDSERVVMIGDTRFDIEMGYAAGVRTIGVDWGYHGAGVSEAKPDIIASHAADIFETFQDWGWI